MYTRWKDPQRCRSYYFQEDYESYVRSVSSIHIVQPAVSEKSVGAEDEVEDAVPADQGGGNEALEEEEVGLGCPRSEMEHESAPRLIKREEEAHPVVLNCRDKKAMEPEKRDVIFWLKLMAVQMLLLNILLAALVFVVMSR